MQQLSPGQNGPLPEGATTVTVRVAAAQGHVDVIALLLDGARHADDENGVVLFSNLQAAGGAVQLELASDTVTVSLGALPAAIETVLVVAQADGAPTVQGAGVVDTVIAADGVDVASVRLDALPAVATLQVAEIYRRAGAWKVRALGDGYAEGLAKLLEVHGITVDDAPPEMAAPVAPEPPATPTPVAPEPPATPVNLEKQRIVDLRKKVPVSLVKSFDGAASNLERHGLVGERAEVVLVLDVSGSSARLFRNGAYQALIERCLAAGLLFDDNGTIDTWLFDSDLHEGEPVTLENYVGWTDRALLTPGIFRGTKYALPLEAIKRGLQRGARTPTFVYFVTDGGNSDRRETAKIVTELAELPAFLKFIAVGKERDFPFLHRLDDLKGRAVDNADFFAVEDPHHVEDEAFFALVMQEFRAWLVAARAKGILG